MQRFTEKVIFNVRWILPLFYIGLVAVMLVYGYAYTKEIIHLMPHVLNATMDEMKIVVLDMVDVVMVANLVKMIISGSYNSFISKEHGYKNENYSSGTLKIKIATSVVVVATIHMLRTFVTETLEWPALQQKLWLFGSFLLAALVLSFIEYLHNVGEVHEHKK